MKFLPLLLYFFFVGEVVSIVPTLEGLFRHGANPNIAGELVVMKALIKKEEKAFREEEAPIHIKLIFSLEVKGRIQLIQALYQNGRMEDSALLNVGYFRSLNKAVLQTPSLAQGAFYSLLSFLVSNESSTMMSFLKKRYPPIKSNKEIINKNKMALLEEYKKYLMAIKNSPSGRPSLRNPMRSSDANVRRKIAFLLNAQTFTDENAISLKKEGQRYYWMIDQEGLTAKFENDTHRIKYFRLIDFDGKIEVDFGTYLAFNGTHQLPKEILFGLTNEKTYRIRVTSLSHLALSSRQTKTMKERYSEYRKKLAKAQKRAEKRDDFLRPSFLKL